MTPTRDSGSDLPAIGTIARPPRRGPSLHRLLVGLDSTAVVLAWTPLVALIEPPGSLPRGAVLAAVTVVALILLRAQRLWLARVCLSRLEEARRLGRVALGTAVAGLAAGGGGWPAAAWAAAGGAATLILLSMGRSSYDAWLRAERAQGRFTRSVVIVGQGDEAERVVELLAHHPELGYRVGGLLGDRAAAGRLGVRWLGPVDGEEPPNLWGISGAVVAAAGLEADQLNRLVRRMLERGLHVQLSSGLWSLDHRRVRVAPLAHEPFLYVEPGQVLGPRLAVKRAVDLAGASLVLLAGAPALALAALAIKLGDGGPVLFRQVRVGRDGKPFTLLKFRTMVPGAEALLGQIDGNERSGPLFKLKSDPRVTRVGRMLRATSLDELPQLFNVLGGSMSLVGPRPALPSEVEHFDAVLRERHRLRPGVTGLWQLEARDNASFYAYRHLDLYYVDNWSLALDFVVLAATVPAVVARALRSRAPAPPLALPALGVDQLRAEPLP